MEKRSDSLFTIPDDPNTLTCQSFTKNDTPRDPLHGSVTWNHAQTRPNQCYVYTYAYAISISATLTISASTLPMHQYSSQRHVSYLTP